MNPPADDRTRYLKLRSVLWDRTTGLPAFPVLLDDLRAMLDERRCIGVVLVEIDGLDLIDSLYGWQVLDRLMVAVSRAALAAADALPGRALVALDAVAGERVLLFLPEAPDGSDVDEAWLADTSARVAAAVASALRAPEFEGLAPRLVPRVGHAPLSFDPFYRFERRVYAAIDRARSVRTRRSARRERSRREELERIIRDALIDTVFQPVVELSSGDVLGYEAFARGPSDSPLAMPAEMFEVSRGAGVSADLDRTCRRAALRASAFAAGRSKIFLNALPVGVDPRGLGDDDPSLLLGGESILRPQEIVIELSERQADEDPEAFAAVVDGLKRLGFGVAVDDVGTGYASQAILERARPDYVKLDISLVRGVDDDLIKQEVLSSIVRIAERVGAAVIAEGVERPEEVRALRAAGARYGQGFAFAPPGPAESLPRGPMRTDAEGEPS